MFLYTWERIFAPPDTLRCTSCRTHPGPEYWTGCWKGRTGDAYDAASRAGPGVMFSEFTTMQKDGGSVADHILLFTGYNLCDVCYEVMLTIIGLEHAQCDSETCGEECPHYKARLEEAELGLKQFACQHPTDYQILFWRWVDGNYLEKSQMSPQAFLDTLSYWDQCYLQALTPSKIWVEFIKAMPEQFKWQFWDWVDGRPLTKHVKEEDFCATLTAADRTAFMSSRTRKKDVPKPG